MIHAKKINYSKDDDSSLVSIKKILDELQEIGLRKNISIKTYTDESLLKFSCLEQPNKKFIINNLKSYKETLEIVPSLKKTEPMSRKDDVECLQYALESFNFKMNDDDYDFIGENDIIEIYNIEMIQLWRNLELLKINVYDLLSVLTSEWFVLYERAKVMTDMLLSRYQELYNNPHILNATPLLIPTHLLKAKATEETAVVKISFKFFKPIFHKKTGKKVAFISTQHSSPRVLDDEDAPKLTHIQRNFF